MLLEIEGFSSFQKAEIQLFKFLLNLQQPKASGSSMKHNTQRKWYAWS